MSHPRRLHLAGSPQAHTLPTSVLNSAANTSPAYIHQGHRPYRAIVAQVRTRYKEAEDKHRAHEEENGANVNVNGHGHIYLHPGSSSPSPSPLSSPCPASPASLVMPSPPRTPSTLRIAVPSPAPNANTNSGSHSHSNAAAVSNSTGGNSSTHSTSTNSSVATGPISYSVLPAIESSHRYVLTGTLQQSLFGIVKLAFDRQTKRQVAIKVSRRELASTSQARSGVTVLENVKREAEVMRYLSETTLRRHHKNKSSDEYSSHHLYFSHQHESGVPSLPAISTRLSDMELSCSTKQFRSNGWESTDEEIISSDLDRDESMDKDHTAAAVVPDMSETIKLKQQLQQPTIDGSYYCAKLVEELEDEHFHYLITEFVPGGDLYSTLTSIPEHRVSEQQARTWFRQLVHGMKYMHENYVAHLDMSLENICLDADESVRIIDYGVAAIHPLAPVSTCASNYFSLASSSLSTISFTKNSTQAPCTSSFLCKPVVQLHNKPGKIRYMSPELYGNHAWDAYKNDIFSLGVILYSLLTGRPPFQQASSSDIWFHVIYSGQWLHANIRSQASAHVYTHLSESALNLLDSILKPQNQRPELDEILAHPWMNETMA